MQLPRSGKARDPYKNEFAIRDVPTLQEVLYSPVQTHNKPVGHKTARSSSIDDKTD